MEYCAAFLEKIRADYLNSVTTICIISKSVSMTILRCIVINLINLSTQYLSASSVISALRSILCTELASFSLLEILFVFCRYFS